MADRPYTKTKIKVSNFRFVDKAASEKFVEVLELFNSCFFCNILVFVNSRTSFIHLELLYSMKFEDTGMIIESLLYKLGLFEVTFISNQEFGIVKLGKLQKTLFPYYPRGKLM